ncbi:DNA polymerase III subunit gamma/tau [Larkinella bovis]|uniref:DNA polymerase III subunit gamma/tau n=1 Tax=Larkinella bovis TaxID=683041 RepID=A0ABW0IBX4_9BACT
MDNFVVSARKYRPATFDTVVGQAHITTTLKNAILTNHLAQAFLFCGPRGVGKTTCARILAKTINCQNLGKITSSEAVEPCDECESCLSFNQNASFNIHELDAASNNSVEDIRNLIDQVRYPPQSGKYKIYIIDEVHMLSQAAFNAFLKTLEEPPSYAIFILATTEKHKILPTILSRCQLFDFNRIQPRDISHHLASIAEKEGIQTEFEALELIAQKADGGLRDALSMFDLNVTFSEDRVLRYKEVLENLHILDYDYYFRLTDLLLAADLSQTLLLFDEILRKGFDSHQFIVGLSEHFRNLLVCKDAATIELLQVTETIQQKYLQQAAAAPLSFLLSALSVGAQCDLNYKAAKNQRLHVEICLMKLAHLPHVLDLSALVNDSDRTNGSLSERVEKKKDSSADPNPVTANTETVSLPSHTSEPANGYHSQPNGNGISAVKAAPDRAPVLAEIPKPVSTKLRTTANLVPTNRPTPAATQTAVTALVEVPEVPKEDKPFIFEQLKAAWNTFTRLRDQQGGSQTEQVILNREIALDGTTIHIALDNSLQNDLLNDLRQDLLTYLRQTLHNSQIQLESTIVQQEMRRMIYTPQDKFNYLAEKNPALLELKRTLGLDVDY